MNRSNIHQLNIDEFHYIPGNDYTIGISKHTIDALLPRLPVGFNPQFLYHSFPQHQIHLPSFYIAKHYVTVSQFARFIEETGFITQSQRDGWAWTWENGWTKKEGLSWKKSFGIDELDALYDEHADTMCVLQVSCNDAKAYCEYLSQMTGHKVLLPTEFMWEAFATVVGIPTMEHCQELSPNKNTELHEYCYKLIELTKHHEMLPGVIWEWTDSDFQGYPGCRPHKEYGTTYKVLRGGSYFSSSLQKAREYRFRRCPTARSPFYTFRVCIVP